LYWKTFPTTGADLAQGRFLLSAAAKLPLLRTQRHRPNKNWCNFEVKQSWQNRAWD
jgi:hypothetical protein